MLNIIQNTIGAIRRVGESVVRAGLKMWLPFTTAEVGASNQTTSDISGNDNDAILKTGKALQFTGNDSVQTSFSSSYTIKTIAFWINPTHSSTNEVVFYGGGGMAGTRELRLDHLQLEAINGNIAMNTYVNGSLEGVTFYDTPATLTQNEWQRVVLTSSTGFTVVSDTFDIGSGLYGSDGRFIMSDLQIYDEAWTTDDIAYDYANPQKLVTDSEDTSITLDNLKAWWHLSEGDGTVAFDSAPLLGKELVVNGDFATDSDWTVYDRELTSSSGWGISNGAANYDGTGSQFNRIYQGFTTVVGRTYKMTFTLSGLSGNTVNFGFGNWNGSLVEPQIQYGSNGTYTRYMVADRTDHSISIQNNTATQTFSIDNISVKEVFNIDGETYDGSTLGASYVDAQERIPQLGMMNWSKGSNLLEYSEDFSKWSNVSSGTGSQVVLTENQLAPDGTLSATKMFFDKGTGSSTTDFSILQTSFSSQSNTASVYLRADTAQKIMIRNSSTFQLIDVSTDWVRINKTDSGGSIQIGLRSGYVSGEPNTSTIYVWGAQVESGTTATAYRRTNGTAVTDATLISSATDSQKDILGNAVRIKGSGFNLDGTGYGEVPHSTDFDFGTGDFSVSAWVKYSYIAQGSSYNAIYTNGGQVDSAGSFGIMSVNGGFVRILVNNIPCSSTTLFSQGTWLHMVATRNSGTISLYINGNKTPEATATNGNTVTSSQNPRIGWDSNVGRYYNDLIDDVQIYNRALTPDEVEQNYNATKTGHNN